MNNDKKSGTKRKFHQKSRNGCSTCKRRRVKCDETRPICSKCNNLNLVCGYTVDPVKSVSPPTNHVKLENDDEPDVKRRKSGSESNRSSISGNHSSVSSINDVPFEKSPHNPNHGTSDHHQDQGDVPTNGNPPNGDNNRNNSITNKITSLLNAGNLNNINLSHLVNSLTELGGDLSSLGNLASLTNLATLAQLPIDISNLGTLIDSQIHSYIPDPNSNTNGNGGVRSNSNDGTDNEGGGNPGQDHGHDRNNNNGGPSLSANISSFPDPMGIAANPNSNLNMLDLRLMFHYTSQVASTITGAGISDTNIWNYDIPMLAFDHPFLMHSILAFSATHLSRTEKGLDQCVTYHRGDALRLLREAVLDINSDNTDALVASALILIMDSLANASLPSSTSPKSLPASAWIFHVKGAATILTAVWPLTETSRFYKFISVDLGDLGDIINQRINLSNQSLNDDGNTKFLTDLECHDNDISDLFPVPIDSPYLITLAYLNKLHKERYKSDFILRIFAFPALLDKSFLSLLMNGDIKSMRIMRSYYKLLRSFTTEMKDKVWFLEGVANILPVDVEEYAGGAGGMHMMLDFLGGGPSIIDSEFDEEIKKFDASQSLVDTNNLPSDITSDLDVMQAADAFMNMK